MGEQSLGLMQFQRGGWSSSRQVGNRAAFREAQARAMAAIKKRREQVNSKTYTPEQIHNAPYFDLVFAQTKALEAGERRSMARSDIMLCIAHEEIVLDEDMCLVGSKRKINPSNSYVTMKDSETGRRQINMHFLNWTEPPFSILARDPYGSGDDKRISDDLGRLSLTIQFHADFATQQSWQHRYPSIVSNPDFLTPLQESSPISGSASEIGLVKQDGSLFLVTTIDGVLHKRSAGQVDVTEITDPWSLQFRVYLSPHGTIKGHADFMYRTIPVRIVHHTG